MQKTIQSKKFKNKNRLMLLMETLIRKYLMHNVVALIFTCLFHELKDYILILQISS